MPSRWLIRVAHPDPASCRVGWLHAVVASWLDADAATHRANAAKGWAISPLGPLEDGGVGFEIGLVDDGLLGRLHAAARDALGSGIRLGPHDVQLDSHTSPSGLDCVGSQSWEDLAATPPCGGVHLEFLTPTGFRARSRWSALPTFERVFGHYRSRWRQFAPHEPHLVLHEVVDASPLVELETSSLELLGREVRGVTGRVVFELVDPSSHQEAAVAALAAIAPYAGTGSATTSGMGVTAVRLLPSRSVDRGRPLGH